MLSEIAICFSNYTCWLTAGEWSYADKKAVISRCYTRLAYIAESRLFRFGWGLTINFIRSLCANAFPTRKTRKSLFALFAAIFLYHCFLFVLFFFSQAASTSSMLYVVCFMFVCLMCLSILCLCVAYIPYLIFLGFLRWSIFIFWWTKKIFILEEYFCFFISSFIWSILNQFLVLNEKREKKLLFL